MLCLAFLVGIWLGIGNSFFQQKFFHQAQTLKYSSYNETLTAKVIKRSDVQTRLYYILYLPDKDKYIRSTIGDRKQKIYPDDVITFTGNLYRFPKPAFKGDYDFSFFAKAQNLYALGRIVKIHSVNRPEFSWGRTVEMLRETIKEKFFTHLSPENASIAIAMTTGDRTTIPKYINDLWRNAGIYHILSISGLHMSVIAGLMFFLARGCIYFYFPLGNYFDTKKIAALFAIICCIFYNIIAGDSVPATRSLLMVIVIMGAVLLDRQVFSLRNGLFAYCLILLYNPIELYQVGFGLSFTAVLGILLVVDILRDIFSKKEVLSLKDKIFSFFSINITASLVGMPLSIMTFGVITRYSFLTNLLAVPLSSIFVMPLIVLSLFMMLFHLESYPLYLLNYILDFINHWALWVSELPDNVQQKIPPTLWHITLFYMGLYIMCLFKKWQRLYGFSFVIISVISYHFYKGIDVIEFYSPYRIAYIDSKNHIRIVEKSELYPPSSYLHKRLSLSFGVPESRDYFINYCKWNEIFYTREGHKIICKKYITITQ